MATDIKKIAECGKGEALEGRQVRLIAVKNSGGAGAGVDVEAQFGNLCLRVHNS